MIAFPFLPSSSSLSSVDENLDMSKLLPRPKLQVHQPCLERLCSTLTRVTAPIPFRDCHAAYGSPRTGSCARGTYLCMSCRSILLSSLSRGSEIATRLRSSTFALLRSQASHITPLLNWLGNLPAVLAQLAKPHVILCLLHVLRSPRRVIALRAQASAAQRSEESRLSGKNRRASREEKPVAQ